MDMYATKSNVLVVCLRRVARENLRIQAVPFRLDIVPVINHAS